MKVIIDVLNPKTNKKQFLRVECENQEYGRAIVAKLKLKYPNYIITIMSWYV